MAIIFVVSVGLSVCLFVSAEFFSAVFDLISIKLGVDICYMSGSSCVPRIQGLCDPWGWVTPKKL